MLCEREVEKKLMKYEFLNSFPKQITPPLLGQQKQLDLDMIHSKNRIQSGEASSEVSFSFH